MKEICDRTGLTDRAVRLYISEGLVRPHTETGYSGRSSIDFSEDDLSQLARIATLRRVGFSIADIRAMMENPTVIAETVERYRVSVAEEIMEKEKTAALIDSVGESGMPGEFASLADAFSEAVRQRDLPKEDNRMTQKEKLKHFTRRLLLPLAALCLTIAGAVSVFRIMIQTLLYGNDGGILIKMGGGYFFRNTLTPEWAEKCAVFIPAAILIVAAIVLEILYITHIERIGYLLPSACAVLASPAALMLFRLTADDGHDVFETFMFIHFRFDYGLHPVNWGDTAYYLFLSRFFIAAFILLCVAYILAKRNALQEKASDMLE